MAQSFELTKEGIKLSYLRFLSDSAAGFVVLLLLALAYSKGLPLPVLGDSWLDTNAAPKSTDVKVFLFVLSFLIATPLGLMLNGVSFFLLGPVSAGLVSVWERLPKQASYLIVGTRRSYHADTIVRFFGLRPWLGMPEQSSEREGRGRLFDEANYYEGFLSFYFPSYYEQLDHLRGLRLFVRSLAFLALVVSVYCFSFLPQERSENHVLIGGLAMAGFLLLLLYNSLLDYYQLLKTLFMTYTLSSKLLSSNPSREQIIDNLIKLSGRLHST